MVKKQLLLVDRLLGISEYKALDIAHTTTGVDDLHPKHTLCTDLCLYGDKGAAENKNTEETKRIYLRGKPESKRSPLTQTEE